MKLILIISLLVVYLALLVLTQKLSVTDADIKECERKLKITLNYSNTEDFATCTGAYQQYVDEFLQKRCGLDYEPTAETKNKWLQGAVECLGFTPEEMVFVTNYVERFIHCSKTHPDADYAVMLKCTNLGTWGGFFSRDIRGVIKQVKDDPKWFQEKGYKTIGQTEKQEQSTQPVIPETSTATQHEEEQPETGQREEKEPEEKKPEETQPEEGETEKGQPEGKQPETQEETKPESRDEEGDGSGGCKICSQNGTVTLLLSAIWAMKACQDA